MIVLRAETNNSTQFTDADQHATLLSEVHLILCELDGLHDEGVPHVQRGQVHDNSKRWTRKLQQQVKVQLQRLPEHPALDLQC